ncbi:ATP-binding protein [Lactiplantibacillus paraplantarum]|nr:ATP-binding protein [Lactiplantibacillus paraplantarum]MDL2063655.1 hypothetical protein [Lactiplantibacillus paraplantarum]
MRASSNSLDTEVIKNYGIDDLEISDINQYREKLQARESYQLYERFSLEDFLTRIGVLTKDYARDGRLGVTVGGLLFFGKNNAILHTFPNFQLDYYDKRSLQQERWSKRISSIEDNLNIFSFYKKTDDALMATIENRFELNDQGERIDTFGSMHVALREGLINMLMHADYSGETPVILNNTTNYFEFINPGKMKIPSKDFFTTSKTSTRNPIISKLFIQIGIGERAGHGGEKIYECALINKFKFPEINTDLTHTTLKIWKVDLANSFSGKQITDRERLVLKALVSQSHSLTHKELENITHLSRSITSTTIANLLQKDLIKRYGKTKSTKYGIQPTTEQVLAQAQTIPDLVRSILNIHADH